MLRPVISSPSQLLITSSITEKRFEVAPPKLQFIDSIFVYSEGFALALEDAHYVRETNQLRKALLFVKRHLREALSPCKRRFLRAGGPNATRRDSLSEHTSR